MERLSEMVKDADTNPNPNTFNATELDIPAEATEATEAVEDTTEVAPVEDGPPVVGITGLSNWLEENIDSFPNINIPIVTIRGVDPIKNMIITVSDGSGDVDEEGNEKRDLFLFKNAAALPILDMTGVDMQIYNNGFKVVYDYGNGVYIKCYGVKLGLIVVFCNDINGQLIPYSVRRVRKKDDEIECQFLDAAPTVEKLAQPVDMEALHLRYKQSSKHEEGFTTNQEAISWLLERQAEITDINHLLQIDNVIINTLE